MRFVTRPLLVALAAAALAGCARTPPDPVRRALAFLAAKQRRSGELSIYVLSTVHTPRHAFARHHHPSPFITTFVVHALVHAGERGPLLLRARDFVASQRSRSGAWNFYGTTGFEAMPDDLDDTACALAALHEAGAPASWEPSLFLRNRSADGSFKTWLGGTTPGDTGCVVNANVLWLASLARRPELAPCAWLNALVAARRFSGCDAWYPGALPFLHALTRAYADGGAACLAPSMAAVREHLRSLQRPDGGFGSALDDCLAAVALANAKDDSPALARVVARIRAQQALDGSWPAATFFQDALRRYGSEELTTAICVEALVKATARR